MAARTLPLVRPCRLITRHRAGSAWASSLVQGSACRVSARSSAVTG